MLGWYCSAMPTGAQVHTERGKLSEVTHMSKSVKAQRKRDMLIQRL